MCLEHRWRSGVELGMGSYQLGIYRAKFSQRSAADPGLIDTQASGLLIQSPVPGALIGG